MNFERRKKLKDSLDIGIRGIIKLNFSKKELMFQTHIYESMQSPCNWSFEKRSWKGIPYYIIEVRNLEESATGPIAWAHFIPAATQDKVSLFYIKKDAAVEFARERIDRGWYYKLPHEMVEGDPIR